jgi:hypothetical protein
MTYHGFVPGPRVTMMDTNYERHTQSDTPSPVGEEYCDKNINTAKEIPPVEDSMGGLEGVFSAEEHGAVSNKRNKRMFS